MITFNRWQAEQLLKYAIAAQAAIRDAQEHLTRLHVALDDAKIPHTEPLRQRLSSIRNALYADTIEATGGDTGFFNLTPVLFEIASRIGKEPEGP